VDVVYDSPAKCAARLLSRDADLGIVPAVIIPQIPEYKIVSNYCIGADGPVRSVAICSSTPLEKIERLYLDGESRTSILLARLLLNEYKGLFPKTITELQEKEIDPSDSGAAYVLIGDKVFRHEADFPYIYDLAQMWKEFRNLPFVFAAWTAVNPLSDDFCEAFNLALSDGIGKIPEAVAEYKPQIGEQEAVKYLTENIKYELDEPKHKALIEFWSMASRYRS
jgi:chorismate dehydratase